MQQTLKKMAKSSSLRYDHAIGCQWMPLYAIGCELGDFFWGAIDVVLRPRYWLSLFRWRRCKQKVRPVVCADRQANRSVTMQRNQEGWRQIDIGYEGSLQSCQTYLHLDSASLIQVPNFHCEMNKTWKVPWCHPFPQAGKGNPKLHLSCSKTPSSRA